jgi:flagellar biosynthesis protein FlhF
MASVEANSNLHVKSYFAASVADAMELAHSDLGADALLLNAREAPPEARHLGELEVVFGARPATALPLAAPKAPVDPILDLGRRMDALCQIVTRAIPATHRDTLGDELAQALCAAGVTREVAVEVEAAVHQRLRGRGVLQMGRSRRLADGNIDGAVSETVQELDARFEVAPEVGRIVALVGPPGAGKTSALVKLAVSQGLMARRPVRLLSIDHYRIAAADQMRTYAAILGVPFFLAETMLSLAQAIDSSPQEALILIDTPGHTAASINESGSDLAAFLQNRQDIDTHLVLTASTRQTDLRRIIDMFAAFRPSKLLFSRLDETDSTAAIFCEAARTGLPLSFLCNGQVIPDDLEPATKARITAGLVRELPQALQAVA